MRRLSLARAALTVLAATLPGVAIAQTAPGTTFPITTRPGKLDGAAPGSVTVSIGGTMFDGMAFPKGNQGVDRPLTRAPAQH